MQGNAGVSLTEIRNFDLVQVMARRGQRLSWQKPPRVRFGGMAAPVAPKAVQTSDATLIWSGRSVFSCCRRAANTQCKRWRRPCPGPASLSDQSHARALIGISGSKARIMLAKLSSIDLHPRHSDRCGCRDVDGSYERHALRGSDRLTGRQCSTFWCLRPSPKACGTRCLMPAPNTASTSATPEELA